MKKVQIGIIIGLVVFLVAISTLLMGEVNQLTRKNEGQVEKQLVIEKPVEKQLVIEKPVEEVKQTATIAMMGDILLHTGLTGYTEYTSSFLPMEDVLQSYDFLIANQESLPVGNHFALDGYPQFSSPDYLLRDLKVVGVDMVNIANNHVVDKGEEGVRTLFENLAKYDMPYVGAYASQEDAMTDRIVELNGISIGLLSYTYGTNGLYLPQDSPFIIHYIDDAKVATDIARVKSKVDVTVVQMHWGPEFTTQENSEQQRLATLINEAGADIVFGTHPHVLQPYDLMVSATGKETHVFYSLGNYFSLTTTSSDSMIGGIGSLHITKQGEHITIEQPTLIATAMLLDADGMYRVHPLATNETRAVRNMDWVKAVIGDRAIVQ